MEIISHRGYWKTIAEKNKTVAFENSFCLNLGTETDFRDYNGGVVISHDIATSESISAEVFFDIYNKYKCASTLALNIKADGLQVKLKEMIDKHKITEYFVFDMSIPDTLGYIDHEIDFYTRQSEYEPYPAFYTECKGIWLDAFKGIWYNNDLITDHLKNNKKVAIVSSELHKRDHLQLWEQLRSANLHQLDGVILCTDLPEKAQLFFNQ